MSFETFLIETDQTGVVTIASPTVWQETLERYRVGPTYTKDRLLCAKRVQANKDEPPYFAFWGNGITLDEWAKKNGVAL